MPIQRKVTVVTLLTSSAVLLVATGALFAFQLISFRQSFMRDLSVLSEIIANNSTAALAFRDQRAAREVLSALRAKPHVVSAWIQLPDGSEFARFGAPGARNDFTHMPIDGYRFEGHYLLQGRSIILNREPIGTLYLQSDYQSVYQELIQLYGGILATVLAVSFIVALLLSARLQRFISGPILRLADTAKVIAEKRDYSVRAEKMAQDELGLFTDAFNQMLAQIQAQDADLQAAHEDLARQVAALQREIAERKQAEGALRESRALYHSLVEQMPAGVFRKDRQGRYVLANSWFCHLRGMKAEEILGKTPEELVAVELAEQGGTRPGIIHLLTAGTKHHERIMRSGEQVEVEEEYPAVDGRKRYLHVVKSPVFGPDGKLIGTQGVQFDMTALKQAEEELRKAQVELLEVSRQAGMAEVATGVLHNVGNVLNSLNVSVTLMRERLRKPRLENLNKVTLLLHEHGHDLASFLTNDPKGKLIPEYLSQLANCLAGENSEALRAMDEAAKNVEHIKEIVSMQQSYARIAGVFETLRPASLVNDALQVHAVSLEREGIKVVREFDEVAPITVDKHKVLQILINLVSNAKYALRESGRQDKVLCLGIAANGNGRLKITVSDNGIGIIPENLTRIFSHGFTTKKEGHGFGLHSGAIAAKEMGGNLTAHSDGTGRGATFTLELPTSNLGKSA